MTETLRVGMVVEIVKPMLTGEVVTAGMDMAADGKRQGPQMQICYCCHLEH